MGRILNTGEVVIWNWDHQWTVNASCYPAESYLISNEIHATFTMHRQNPVIYCRIANSEILVDLHRGDVKCLVDFS